MRKFLVCGMALCLLACALAPAAWAWEDAAESLLDGGKGVSEQLRTLDADTLLEELGELVRGQLAEPVRMLARAVALLLLCAGVQGIAGDSEWSTPMKTVLAAVVFLEVSDPILELLTDVGDTVQQCSVYLGAFVPTFTGILISCGQPGAAAVYSGMFLTVANLTAQVITGLALPLLHIFLALHAAACIGGLDGLPDAANLLYRAARWVLSMLSMVLGGVLGLQSILAHGSDSLALTAGKFFTGSIPVVGSLASSAAGSVLAGLKVLKGTLGVAAIGGLAVMFGPVLIRCTIYGVGLRLAAALSKALALDDGQRILEGLAKGVELCCALMVYFFMLVVIATALMIVTGGGG